VDIKEYISSGILEAYVLGSVSHQEKKEVEENSGKYPEIRKELRAIEDGLFHYASKYSKNPPYSLKKKVMNAIAKADKQGVKENYDHGKVISVSKRETAPYMVAAAITFALGCALAAGIFWQKWQHAEEKIAIIQLEKGRIAEGMNAVRISMEEKFKKDSARLAQVYKELQMVMDSGTAKVHLKGMAPSPSSTAIVLWNKNSQDVFINLKDLPQPPDSMQYQLWALHKGKPVDAGLIEMADPEPYHKMKSVAKAEAFAITLEKKGGSASPDPDALYLMGKLN
jgi:anti-sigma-K factor RskA